MTLGNILKERDDQYIANRDASGTWRILDTWHDDLKSIGPEDEIPDKTEAVTILSEGAFIYLMKEAGRSGLLDHASTTEASLDAGELTFQYEQAIEKIANLESKLVEQKEKLADTQVYSEHSHIKEKAMDTVLKLAGMDTLISQRFNDLGKE